MTDLSKLDFDDLAPREAKFTLAGQRYVLTEASAGAAAAYDNRKMRDARLTEDGTVARFENFADLGPYAVSLCLFRVTGDGPRDREPVTEEWVRGLPDRVFEPIHAALRDISPTTFGVPSLESLVRQRDKLNEAIAALEAKKGDPKGQPAGTTPTSSTAGS